MGITQGRKDLNYNELVICEECGSYGRYQVYMTYMCLSLFFIPVFKWNKKYYVQNSCCNTVYELDPEVGKQIQWGEHVEIRPQNLNKVYQGNRISYKRCNNCGYATEEDFEFCPKCGMRF
ncbi:MAG: zinc ribbon domain-containing protein [Eubacteriales bacterium]|nr:zinc ribbon domain-containing protein [Eubacteriales bacterium]